MADIDFSEEATRIMNRLSPHLSGMGGYMITAETELLARKLRAIYEMGESAAFHKSAETVEGCLSCDPSLKKLADAIRAFVEKG